MENHKKSFFEVRQLATIGMLSSISIFMGLTGIGFIPLPFMKATIMHIPVIIGAIIEGPIVGAAVGLVFGLFSIYQNITAPTLLSPVFMNPIVAIIPRVLIGIISYYIYKFIKNKFNNSIAAYGFAAAAGTITNTVGVLGLTFLLFRNQYASLKNLSPEAVAGTLGTIILTNGLPECIISILIIIPVATGLFKVYRHRK
ncbi:ECF transporter S component [Clostridium sp. SHJSY1]|uniref:ECF transporter S component n=1 Tax=Clostridium sp. SHJSY1 TaxID=2942483 RepID=UPI002875B41A|nr:ECF transporter S component [Clostridium sp. SHJSY1]MDS0525073.1 ECF transporter S component [Clostridium sp. SHJSY1]